MRSVCEWLRGIWWSDVWETGCFGRRVSPNSSFRFFIVIDYRVVSLYVFDRQTVPSFLAREAQCWWKDLEWSQQPWMEARRNRFERTALGLRQIWILLPWMQSYHCTAIQAVVTFLYTRNVSQGLCMLLLSVARFSHLAETRWSREAREYSSIADSILGVR